MLDGRRVLGRLASLALGAGVLAGSVAAGAHIGGGWAAAALYAPAAALSAVRDARTEPQAVPAEAVQPVAAPTPAPQPAPSATPAPFEPEPSPSPAPAPSGTLPGATAPPELLAGVGGAIEPRQYGQGSGEGYITLAAGSIRNSTERDDAVLAAAAAGPLPFEIELDSAEPQVLILHTHATETYQLWDDLVFDPGFAARTQDKTANMCAVGARMAEVLNAAGINTLHDETLHDSPSYTESYGRSAQTARAYLEQYPSIKVILDVHRDAIEADGMRIKPVADINGEPTAQVMLIAGCDNGTTVNLPRWEQNLAFAAAWEQAMESAYPGLTRPVLCGYRFYNQDITTGSLLIEVGGHANTLAEAVRAGEYAARALAGVLGASA